MSPSLTPGDDDSFGPGESTHTQRGAVAAPAGRLASEHVSHTKRREFAAAAARRSRSDVLEGRHLKASPFRREGASGFVLRIHVYGDPALPAVQACVEVLRDLADVVRLVDHPGKADVAVAPLLTQKLAPKDYNEPRYGTLIFHPSLLPRHRGRDAIKWAFRLGEKFTGATWFWCDDGYDTGDICEQEILAIRDGELPREFYMRSVAPAAARMLGYIIRDLSMGYVRRRPQIEENASYEPPIQAAPS